MGGELHACGCFDGPFSAEDEALVSIRCAGHYGRVPPLDGYILLTTEAVKYAVGRADKLAGKIAARPKLAASIKTRRR